MNKTEIIESTNLVIYQAKRTNIWDLIEPQKELFEIYLEQHPDDIDMRIKYTLLLYRIFKDEFSAVRSLDTIFLYDPVNIEAILLYGYIHNYSFYVDEKVFGRLNTIITENKEILSLLEYERSWYYYNKELKDLQKDALLKSIEYCNKFVWNYKFLGLYYRFDNEIELSHFYMNKALENVQHIYTLDEKINYFDINEYFNEALKGICITHMNYGRLIELSLK